MTVSIPLWKSSRATVSSHGPLSSPYRRRIGPESMPGRKREGVVPRWTTRTSAARARQPSESSTSRARFAVQRLLATTTAQPWKIRRAVHCLKRERRIFFWSSRRSAPWASTPNRRSRRACSQAAAYPAGLTSSHHANAGSARRVSAAARLVHRRSPFNVRSRFAPTGTRSMVWRKRGSLASLPGQVPVETSRPWSG